MDPNQPRPKRDWPRISLEAFIVAAVTVIIVIIVFLLAFGRFPGDTSTSMSNIVTTGVGGLIGFLGSIRVAKKEEVPHHE